VYTVLHYLLEMAQQQHYHMRVQLTAAVQVHLHMWLWQHALTFLKALRK
jgi:hypothetical protein